MLCTKYTDLVLSHGRRPIRCTPDKCHLSLLRLECGIQRGMGIATEMGWREAESRSCGGSGREHFTVPDNRPRVSKCQSLDCIRII